MNFKQTLLTGILIFVSIFSFAKNATLKGKVINSDKFTEIKLQDISHNTIETQKLDASGNFTFNTTFDKFNFYLLVLNKQNITAFFPEPGEQTEIIIDIKNIKNPKITNSVQTQLYYNFNNKFSKLKNDKEKIEFVKKMIDENPSSPVCIFFVNFLNTDKYYSYHKKLSVGLAKYSGNKIVKDYITKTENVKNLSTGKVAPEISLPNPEGKIIKLSSLRGNYVLIDFWASWCRPCRAENPNNVKLYKKYHDKSFEIYGVSLDRDKNAWLKAIKDDNLTWTQVSDLKFWQSEGAKIYNVRSIPHTVLLDKDGKIIAAGLRGTSLTKKLKEIFGE
ncbi:MAG: TlpA family protein disulfide reductase [Chlorobi bacterium]|nr:TlpA family protein disulfide reductase [Chlorobiota bacterium]